MANNIATLPENAGRVTAPSTAYPLGSAKDDSTGTAGDGTPIKVAYMNDLYGWQQALLRSAGLAPTGNADTAVASQYLQAIAQIAAGRGTQYADTGAADAYVLGLQTNQQAPGALFDGMYFAFTPSAPNTGPATVDVSAVSGDSAGTTVLPVTLAGGATLGEGDISGRVILTYNMTDGRAEYVGLAPSQASGGLSPAGVQSVTGSATFANAGNTLLLAGVGSQGWEVGDVVQFSGSTSNDGLFTISDIVDADNIVVNEAHAGGSTLKSLQDEGPTTDVVCALVSKWYTAAPGLGRGYVNVNPVAGTGYLNDHGREYLTMLLYNASSAGGDRIAVDGITVAIGSSPNGNDGTYTAIVPLDSTVQYFTSNTMTPVDLL